MRGTQARAAHASVRSKDRAARAALAASARRAWDERLRELNDDLGTALR